MSDQSSSPAPEKLNSESPPSGRPRREGNESLWKRARRTLGTNSLTFLQPQARPAGATGSAPGSGPAPPNKRREQVRHAQRTHRQRTQNYIKTLESEVVRLRTSEMQLKEDKAKLQGHVDSLKFIVTSANLPLPPDLEESDPKTFEPAPVSDFDWMASVSYTTDELDNQRLQVSWPQDLSSNLATGYTPGHLQDFNVPPSLPDDISLEPISFSQAPLPTPRPATHHHHPPKPRPSAVDDSMDIAIDFVLALEHPCMAHVPYPADPDSPNPANHVMMMSAPLMAHAPETPRPNMQWTTTGAIIKELLNLSSSINLASELTPVEAWHRLHQHPDFARLDRSAIESLKRELSTAVSCRGFGAVLDEDVFAYYVNQAVAAAGTFPPRR